MSASSSVSHDNINDTKPQEQIMTPKPSVKSMGLNIPMILPGMAPPKKVQNSPLVVEPEKKEEKAEEPPEELERRQSILHQYRRPSVLTPRKSRSIFVAFTNDGLLAENGVGQSKDEVNQQCDEDGQRMEEGKVGAEERGQKESFCDPLQASTSSQT
jgi:hypothetical protein